MNIAPLLAGAGAVAKSVAQHPITKGGSLAALVTGGLYIASAAGVAIPEVAYTLGPIVGYALYKFLPPKAQQAIDSATEELVDTFNEIPTTYSKPEDFPNAPKPPKSTCNLLTKGGQTNEAAK